MTITTIGGAGLSAAAQHSQSLEAMFCHIPGIKVVYPSNAYDVKGLMAACIRDDNPTLFVLHKRMLGQKGVVPEERYQVPLGVANVSRPGDDVTIVSWGKTAADCLVAADDAGRRRHRRRGDRSAHAVAARHRHGHRVGQARRTASSSPTRRCGSAASAPRSRRRSRSTPSTTSTRRSVGSAAPYSPVPFTPALEGKYVPDPARIAAGVREALARPLLAT